MINALLGAYSKNESLAQFHNFKGWAHPDVQDAVKGLGDTLDPEMANLIQDASTTAYYTPQNLVGAMGAFARSLGLRRGKVLDLGCGSGRFLRELENEGARELVGVEIDPISAKIAADATPSATIHATDLKKLLLAHETYDLFIGNVPFGGWQMGDVNNPDLIGLNILDYFLMRGLLALREGGVAVVLASHTFLDKQNSRARQSAAKIANLLSVTRLPSDLFEGASVAVDVLVFQRSATADANAHWVAPPEKEIRNLEGDSQYVNSWFAARPQDCLGRMLVEDSFNGTRLVVEGDASDAVGGLRRALGALDIPFSVGARTKKRRNWGAAFDAASIGGLFVEDGKLYRKLHTLTEELDSEIDIAEPAVTRSNAKGETVPLKPTELERLLKLCELGRLARELVDLERTEAEGSPAPNEVREDLRDAYRAYTKKHGPLNRPANRRLCLEDATRGGLLLALEVDYRAAVTQARAEKLGVAPMAERVEEAPILSRRLGYPSARPTFDSVEQGVVTSLASRGSIDLDFIGAHLGLEQSEVVAQLPDTVIRDPETGSYVTRDEYLSGDVRAKMEAAKALGFDGHADALEAVLPERVPFEDIGIQAGASWMPPHLLEQFFLDTTSQRVQVLFAASVGLWAVNVLAPARHEATYSQWEVEDAFAAHEVFIKVLNSQSLRVYRAEIDPFSDKTIRVLDHERTNVANMRGREFQSAFYAWLSEEAERRALIEDTYNQRFVRFVARDYSNAPLHVDGLFADITPYEYQLGAVKQSIAEGSTLYDHPVGAGKTLEMTMAAMVAKQRGYANKPVIVVPDHLVGQMAAEAARYFPAAQLLTPNATAFHGWRRWRMFAQIATSDFDLMIIGHAAFSRLPLDSKEADIFLSEEKALARECLAQLDAADNAADAGPSYRLKSAIQSAVRRVEKWVDNAKKHADVGLTLEDLGIDFLAIDEAHMMKNLSFVTGKSDLRGINPEGSYRAMSGLMAVRSVRRRGGRVVLATGTPLVNSVAEAYTMQRFLCPDRLRALGVSSFDAWVGTFGVIETRVERRPAGDFGPVTRLARFTNLPELQALWAHTVNHLPRDVMEAEQRERGRATAVPPLKTGRYIYQIAAPSDLQRGMTAQIYKRFEDFRSSDIENDNPLAAMTDARKAAADVRLMVPEAPRFAGSKVVACAENILRLYREYHGVRGTQLVFMDLGLPRCSKELAELRALASKAEYDPKAKAQLNTLPQESLELLHDDVPASLYHDLRDLLEAGGIPRSEIVFATDLKTDKQRTDAYAAMNDGDIRVLMGSTMKMGTGMNAQRRLVALHDVDAPWRPADLEQRHGRIIRQGNDLLRQIPDFEVSIYAYATGESFDSGMWASVETKSRFIAQVRSSQSSLREAEDVNLEAANAATMKAMSTGDPRVMRHVELTQLVKELESGERGQARQKAQLQSLIVRLDALADTLPHKIQALREDEDACTVGVSSRPHRLWFDREEGVHFLKQQDATESLRRAAQVVAADHKGAVSIGIFRGLDVQMEVSAFGIHFYLGQSGVTGAFFRGWKDITWQGVFGRLNTACDELVRDRIDSEERLAGLPGERAAAVDRLNEPSAYAKRLSEAQTELLALDEALGKVETPEGIAQDPSYRVIAMLASEARDQASTCCDRVLALCYAAHSARIDAEIGAAVSGMIHDAPELWPDKLLTLLEEVSSFEVPDVADYEAQYADTLQRLANDHQAWLNGDLVESDTPESEAAPEAPVSPEVMATSAADIVAVAETIRLGEQMDMFAAA